MKTTSDRIEGALDDALGMTFPASDPVAVFMPVATAPAQIERRAPLAARPRKVRRTVSASRDAMDHF